MEKIIIGKRHSEKTTYAINMLSENYKNLIIISKSLDYSKKLSKVIHNIYPNLNITPVKISEYYSSVEHYALTGLSPDVIIFDYIDYNQHEIKNIKNLFLSKNPNCDIIIIQTIENNSEVIVL